jgi:hypothetical protein
MKEKMSATEWTVSEKKTARRVFDVALDRELAEVMAEFKQKAARAETPADMWAIRQYLERAQREIDSKYDYRYSQLVFVFARLLREKRINQEDLAGLAEEKLNDILRLVSHWSAEE